MKTQIRRLFLVLYIFTLLFAPPIIPQLNIIIPLAILSFFLLITKYRDIGNIIINQSGIKNFVTFYFVAFLFCLSRMYLGSLFDEVDIHNYIINLYRFVLLCPLCIICIVYILVQVSIMDLSREEFLRIVIYAGLIQTGICALSMIMPTFKELLLKIMLINGDTFTLDQWTINRRYFGFANNMFDTFGYGTGIIACLPLLFSFEKLYSRIIFFLLLLLVPFMNSRTGLVMIVIGCICLFPVYLYQSKKDLGKNLIMAGITILILYIAFLLLEKYQPLTTGWVKNGIKGLQGLFFGNAEESMGKLFRQEGWYFPKKVNLLIGTGHNVYEVKGYNHSDVGYVNDIWLFGIIGAILFYWGFGWLFYKTWKGSRINHALSIFLALCFFCFNIKGQVIAYNTGNAIILLLCFFTVFDRYRTKRKIKGEMI